MLVKWTSGRRFNTKASSLFFIKSYSSYFDPNVIEVYCQESHRQAIIIGWGIGSVLHRHTSLPGPVMRIHRHKYMSPGLSVLIMLLWNLFLWVHSMKKNNSVWVIYNNQQTMVCASWLNQIKLNKSLHTSGLESDASTCIKWIQLCQKHIQSWYIRYNPYHRNRHDGDNLNKLGLGTNGDGCRSSCQLCLYKRGW